MSKAGLPLLLLLLSASPVPGAGQITVYRCVDPAGGITLQNNAPCPAGSRQQILQFDRPNETHAAPEPESPVPVPSLPMPLVSVPPEAGTPPGESLLEPPAPPALYQCRAYDNELHFRDDATPPSRCRPMQTVGIGGLGSGLGAGAACERVEDTCIEVPEQRLCEAWQTRLREAEFRWRFATGRDAADLGNEYQRLAAIVEASACRD